MLVCCCPSTFRRKVVVRWTVKCGLIGNCFEFLLAVFCSFVSDSEAVFQHTYCSGKVNTNERETRFQVCAELFLLLFYLC